MVTGNKNGRSGEFILEKYDLIYLRTNKTSKYTIKGRKSRATIELRDISARSSRFPILQESDGYLQSSHFLFTITNARLAHFVLNGTIIK